MARCIHLLRLNQNFIFVVITILTLCPLLVIISNYNYTLNASLQSSTSSESRYERYCRQFNESIKSEKSSKTPIHIYPKNRSIPYSYSVWRSSPLMPRAITACEHAIYMNLLSLLIENVFKKYKIQYIMMAATLLGSYTRHDLLPWDDDVDLMVSVTYRYQLQSIIIGEFSQEPYSVIIMEMHNKRNYDKIFFSWCPHAGKTAWRFPFIDIFYFDFNTTHIWQLGQPSTCPVRMGDIFPLVLRPLGSLWLYGPREPMAHFESRNMVKIENGCYAFPYSHKHETLVGDQVIEADCQSLNAVYPYVERKCYLTGCTEYLKSDNTTLLHTVTYDYSYRTFSYSEKNPSFKAC